MIRWPRLLVGSLALGAVLAVLGTATGGIQDSHHDFQGASYTNGEICIPCHTPHDADTTVLDSPLWNHELTTAGFQIYSSSTLDATPGQPGGTSKLCLSCHDGTVAIDAFGGQAGGSRFIKANFKTGTNLTGHHPISFVYDTALATADGELWDPSGTSSGLGGTITTDLLGPGGRLECASCHDVHVERNTAGCSGCHFVHGMTTRSLSIRIDNAASALCLTCHKK